MNQDHVVVFERLLEFRACDDIVVTLAPGGSVVRMIHGNRFKFGIVVTEMDDEFRDAGLQVFDGIQVEVLPAGGRT